MDLTYTPQPDNPNQLALGLTLTCDRDRLSIFEGHVEFAISCGQLQLQWEEQVQFIPNADLASQIDPLLQVTSENREKYTCWTISKTSGDLLTGHWENLPLGMIETATIPKRLVLSLSVPYGGISITDAEGLWKHDISPNKHAILQQKLIQFLWKTCFTPMIAYLEWQSPGEVRSRSVRPRESQSPLTPKYPKGEVLKPILDKIIHAPTDDFMELLTLAELDPKSDLVGANLRGTLLNEVNLSGMNLTGVNLRGADLNDADLSESILHRAKLSGADLSGAFLENADFSQCNLHRASLALVNLGGVNLSGSNLTEANLSNTTWTGSDVKGAIFGNNVGLSEDIKQRLVERGAVFQ